MESNDDDRIFSPPRQPPSPIRATKLRRLRKASGILDPPPVETLDSGPSIPVSDPLGRSDAVESEKYPDLEKPMDRFHQVLEMENFSEKLGMDARSGFLKVQDLEQEEQFSGLDAASDGKGDDGSSELGGETDGLKLEKGTKKRRSLSEAKEKGNKKKKKVENVGDYMKPPEESARSKRKLEKEMEAYRSLIYAESQRLLRETRDASFKPVPPVQKSISSVLEKIRLRKSEVSRKSGISFVSDGLVEKGTSLTDITENFELQHVESCGGPDENAKEDKGMHDYTLKSCDAKAADIGGPGCSDSLSSHNESVISNTASAQKSHTASQTPSIDTQEFCDSQLSDAEEKWSQDLDDSSQEDEAFTPSILATNLKIDAATPADDSSDEEFDDKENIDPLQHKVADFGMSPKGDPVKAFVDDEAEEEDDSDNDLMRFDENEEDEDKEDDGEFDDLIATEYKELPIDSEKRDELHQKWLEQQDVAATDNVLQRLKCGWKQRDRTPLCEEEDEEEVAEDSTNDLVDDKLPANVAQKNSKKVKQMIAQMYNDGDDVFLSSDDEETEQRLVRQRLLEQTEDQASFLSPADNENSREVFGLIKKLNVVPDTKKKAKTSSFFDTLVTGGNSNSSSKSSFLGRAQCNSVPSAHKQGSSVVRSFIFGRDDSNSRSSFSTSEHPSDMDRIENQPARNHSTKCRSPQSKSISKNTHIETSASLGFSLFEILRQSSMHSDHYIQSKKQNGNLEIRQSQAAYQFTAFKSTKKAIKIEN